eukprot:SAG22_NODE_1797_length_3550_cov_2.119386_5_plen_37_part_01
MIIRYSSNYTTTIFFDFFLPTFFFKGLLSFILPLFYL